MKKEQIIEILKLMPTYPPQIGYFFKATQHGLGLIEEAKKIAKEVWKQEFCVIFTNQIDALDLMALCEHHKDKEVTYIFSDMEKFIFYGAGHLDPNGWICIEFITPWRRDGRI